MRADEVIVAPILSEKSNFAREGESKKYTFEVSQRANKHDVTAAVAELFDVTVEKCNVMVVKGKPKYSRGKGGAIKGTTGNWKKAIVTLAKGDTIQAIEGV
ncbi:MAG: 50S ribosomal protein L23 [Sphaerochaetaceae bacterium]|jgi:large subunit ribosomal protein L23|nr:50S ribosomal protein L23 [Sphaerochaetaceae bacterium]